MSRLILFPLIAIALGVVVGVVAWLVNPGADFEKIGQGVGVLLMFSIVFGAIVEHERRKKKAAAEKAAQSDNTGEPKGNATSGGTRDTGKQP
jgi:uncharacterized membrane protein